MRKRFGALSVLGTLIVALGLLMFAPSASVAQLEPPNPIDPSTGETALLGTVNAIPVNEIKKALDNFPVPYVVQASAGGATATIKHNKAGAPTKLDADRSKLTGEGGNDIQVEVNTELTPVHHLRLNITRLGKGPVFAQDVSVVVAFPWDAFNDEDAALLNFDPNLFFGYQTTGPFDAAGGKYAAGGTAPQSLEYRFYPGVLAGDDHDFQVQMNTVGASNPVRFLAGGFDGNVDTGIKNAFGMATHADPVPANIDLSLHVNESVANGDPETLLTDSLASLNWAASQATKVQFDYLENETFPFSIPDFNTTLTFDQMPMSEVLSLRLNEGDDGSPIGGLTLALDGSTPVGKVTFLKEREDGLMVRGIAEQVPRHVALTADLDGELHLDVGDPNPLVNANTMDLTLDVAQRGGFFETGGFLSYDVGLLRAEAIDVPDLTARLSPGDDRYIVTATNSGESIGAVGLALDDGPEAVKGGLVDLDNDGAGTAADDGSLGTVNVIDGRLDVNGDGVVNVDDDAAPLPGSVPSTNVIDGRLDLRRDGVIVAAGGSADTGEMSFLSLPPPREDPSPYHVLSLVDDGATGTVMGRLVNVSGGELDLDGHPVVDGYVDLNDDGTLDDDGTITLDTDLIDGKLDLDGNGTADDDGKLYGDVGATVIGGRLDMDNSGAIDAGDDGALTSTVFGMSTTAPAPLQGYLKTKSGSALFPGRDVSAVCTVEDVPAATALQPSVRFDFGMPPPVLAVGYTIPDGQTIDKIGCIGHTGTLLFETELNDAPAHVAFEFIHDRSLTVIAEDPKGTANSARLGSGKAHFCDDPNLDGVCDDDDGPGGAGIPASADLFGTPLYDAWARIDDTPSFQGKWRQKSLVVTDGLIQGSETNIGGVNIIGGQADVSDDGAISGGDDGRFLGERVVDGKIDTNGDGTGNADDDATVQGTAVGFDTGSPTDTSQVIDGVQVAVSTKRGLAEPAAANGGEDHYAAFLSSADEIALKAGVFGIDEFQYSSSDAGRGIAFRYGGSSARGLLAQFDSSPGGRYFPAFDVDLDLSIDDVPATFNFFTDMANEVSYAASSEIGHIGLDGNVDTTEVDVDFNGLPSQVAWNLAGDIIAVTDGTYAVGNKVVGGVRFIGGRADLNNDGSATDNGFFVGIPVISGGLDVNEDGVVNTHDDGAVAGSALRMNDQLDSISVLLSSAPATIIGTDYRLVDVDITEIPAQWAVNWGGGRFLIESKNAAGTPDPMGQVAAIVSTSTDSAVNDGLRAPFLSTGGSVSGPVVTANNCRVNYSNFAQTVDNNYYTAEGGNPDADAEQVLPRLRELYCDAEKLDDATDEDHAVVRMGDPDGDGQEDLEYGSLQFSDFQRVSFTPDANGGKFILRTGTDTGDHPLFAGYETDVDPGAGVREEFTTVQIGNIPDEVIVDIDKTEHVTYDAQDPTNASFGEIDLYSGPLPMADDDDEATRVVIQPAGGVDATPLESYIHVGWGFDIDSGGAFLDNSDEIEVLLLTQDGDTRITGGLALEDLLVGYALDLLSFDVNDTICILPDPLGGCIVEIPVAWELFQARAALVNDADGRTPAEMTSLSPEDLRWDDSKPDMAGFLGIYTHETGLETISGGPAPGGGGEYVPLITAAEEGFRGVWGDITIDLDPLSPDWLVFSLNVDSDFSSPDLLFDFWLKDRVDFTDDDAIPFIDEVGFVNNPDYVDNKPIHIIPGLDPADPVDNVDFHNEYALVYSFNGWHGFDDHFDPFD